MSSSNKSSQGGAASGGHSNPMDQYMNALPSPTAGSAGAASVRAIIHQALTNPKILAGFAELRSHPSVVAALDKSGEGSDPSLRTLDLFAQDTYSDYASAAPGTYLSLTDGQVNKLRQLTVVSVAQRIAAGASASTSTSTGKKKKGGSKKSKKKGGSNAATTVSYDILQSELGMTADDDASVRDIEDVLISCIYQGLISGRLDQRTMSLWLEPSSDHPGQPPVAARDVKLDDVPRMIEELERFQTRSLNVLSALEGAAKSARDGREADARTVHANEMSVKEAKQMAETRLSKDGGDDPWSAAAAAAAGGPAAMDLSMEGRASGTVARRQTKRSRGGHGGGEGFLGGRF